MMTVVNDEMGLGDEVTVDDVERDVVWVDCTAQLGFRETLGGDKESSLLDMETC